MLNLVPKGNKLFDKIIFLLISEIEKQNKNIQDI